MIKFQEKAVQEAADEYKKVELPKEYRELMENVSKVISPYIGMNDGAVRGFISRSIVTWQERHKMKIAEVLSMSLPKRQEMMKEGMDILKEILGKILKTPSDQEKLNKAINDGYNAYLTKFMPKKWVFLKGHGLCPFFCKKNLLGYNYYVEL